MGGLRVRIVAAVLATLASVGLVLLASVSRTHTGLALDEQALQAALQLPEWARTALGDFARPLVIVALAPVVAYLALRAVVRARPAAALTAALVPLLATWVTHLVHAGQVVDGAPSTFPSTHASLGAALVAGAVVAWPRRVAWWGMGLAVVAVAALALGNVTSHAHFPRDVLGSLLVVAALWCACVALMGRGAANLSSLHAGPRISGLRSAPGCPPGHDGTHSLLTDRHTAA
jgi:membrane-associated phospholipid phosphatase